MQSKTDLRTLPLPGAAVILVLFIGAITTAWLTTSRDSLHDAAIGLAALPWLTISALFVLLVVATIHFLCAGIALRDVAGTRLPLRQVTLVQLAAGATNRMIPSGLGGAAVNLRFLVRAGLSTGAASSALATLTVVGGVTDAAYVATITGLGPSIGLGGAGKEFSSLASSSLATGHSRGWLIAVMASAAFTLALTRLHGRIRTALLAVARQAAGHMRALSRRPSQVGIAAAASMATTAVLTLGFIIAVRAWGHSPVALPAGGLIALYWAGVAAGGAAPLPAFCGVTEAALIAGLVVAGYSPSSATVTVLAFRLVTFWIALPVGAWAGSRLRRAELL